MSRLDDVGEAAAGGAGSATRPSTRTCPVATTRPERNSCAMSMRPRKQEQRLAESIFEQRAAGRRIQHQRASGPGDPSGRGCLCRTPPYRANVERLAASARQRRWAVPGRSRCRRGCRVVGGSLEPAGAGQLPRIAGPSRWQARKYLVVLTSKLIPFAPTAPVGSSPMSGTATDVRFPVGAQLPRDW